MSINKGSKSGLIIRAKSESYRLSFPDIQTFQERFGESMRKSMTWTFLDESGDDFEDDEDDLDG
jgi:hypothetical protein